MTALTRHSVRLSDPGELIAAVPHMLGFHPHDSLVLIALTGPRGRRLSFTLRADLPPSEDYRLLAEQVLGPMVSNGAQAVCLALVGGDPPARDPVALGDLPHGGLVDILEDVFADAEIPLAHAVWVAEIRPEQRWYCYDDPQCRGILTDPMGSTLAAASAAAGVVTYASRADLVAGLAPPDEAAVTRRRALLDEPSEGSTVDSQANLDVLRAAIDTADEQTPLTDQQVVRLARALGDHLARDACLDPADEAERVRAERLWTTLVRETPAPERAEPASLLAFCSYLRGDGALAGIALDIAEQANPVHQLSAILREILDRALPPVLLAEVATKSAAQALEAIHAASTGTDRESDLGRNTGRDTGGTSQQKGPPAAPG